MKPKQYVNYLLCIAVSWLLGSLLAATIALTAAGVESGPLIVVLSVVNIGCFGGAFIHAYEGIDK